MSWCFLNQRRMRAGSVTVLEGFFGGGEVLGVFDFGSAGRATWAAENSCGFHAYDEDAFEGGVFVHQGLVHGFSVGQF